jgi:chromate reductase, NAD(P)H dehydrogenase (quinone)
MTTHHKVGYFIGSLSSTSINRLLSKALIKLAPPELQMTEIVFRDLPSYSPDHDANYPPVARAFKPSHNRTQSSSSRPNTIAPFPEH